MKKFNPTVIAETKYIASVVAVLSIIMQCVFLIAGKWSYKVILGNLYSDIFVILNFWIMGNAVSRAVEKEEKEARNIIKTSHTLRTFMMFAALAVGVLLPVFNILSVIIHVFFVRIAVSLRPIFNKKEVLEKGEKNE